MFHLLAMRPKRELLKYQRTQQKARKMYIKLLKKLEARQHRGLAAFKSDKKKRKN
jgi:hypothetical protein